MGSSTVCGPIQSIFQACYSNTTARNEEESYPLNAIKKEETLVYLLVEGCSCHKHLIKTLEKINDLGSPAETENLDGIAEHHEDADVDEDDYLPSACDVINSPGNAIEIEQIKEWAETFKNNWDYLVQKTADARSLVLCQVIQNKPTLLGAFLETLSSCIYFQSETSSTTACIRLDFKYLLEIQNDSTNFRESYVLHRIVKEIDDSESKNFILAHPIVKAIVTLKCQKHQLIPLINLIYQFIFALLFTISTFIMLSQQNFHDSAVGIIAAVLNGILGSMALLSLVKTFTLCFSPKTMFIHTWVQKLGKVIAPLVAITTCVVPTFLGYPILISKVVNKDITAFGVMISWLVMLSYLTKFLWTAAYVETFFQIVKNFIEFFFFVAIWLFVALTASHSIIFHRDEEEFAPFANVSRSFIRVITGRMNYDAFTDDKTEFDNPGSIFMYFFLFVIFYTVMASVIIGLATNELKKTCESSALNVLCQAIEDIAELEWILAKPLRRFSNWWLHRWLVDHISIKTICKKGNTNHYMLDIYPHDPSDTKLPPSLKKELFNHLIERKKYCTMN